MSIKRNNCTLEKYYTQTYIAELCCDIFKKYININPDKDIIIEPSVGTGSFIKPLLKLTNNLMCYDIDKSLFNIKNQYQNSLYTKYVKCNDFLSINILPTNQNKIFVVGNPPFGRQSTLAIKFIQHMCSFCDAFGLILPKSFLKPTLYNKINNYFHLVHSTDISNNAFLFNNKDYNVPCIFAIYIKKDYKRDIDEKLEPYMFNFTKQYKHHTINFRRVGVNAGTIDLSINSINKSPQSHYYINIDDSIWNTALFEKLKNIKFTQRDLTVGPKSISKQELIFEFNEIIKNL